MSGAFGIRVANGTDFPAWSAMRRALWPDEASVDADADMHEALARGAGAIVLLACDARDAPIGFVEVALRRVYVNGTESSPVGFLEGWYVAPQWRGRGVGRALVDAAAGWVRTQGCSEFASDALLDNAASHAAHRACGFEETERVVYFRKSLA